MSKFDRNHSINALIVDRYPLTRDNSTKETWHVTLDLGDHDLNFHPGDSVGIHPENDPVLVEHLIEAIGAQPTSTILHKRTDQEMDLHTYFTYHANLARITSSFLRFFYECSNCFDTKTQIEKTLQDKACLREFLHAHDPLFLFRTYRAKNRSLQEICDQFGPLLPRFYSIASSPLISQRTIDLTVSMLSWSQDGEKKYGVASHFLCHTAKIKETPIPLFAQPAEHFRLPDTHETDIIMIGPGTGIAPFRAFMQQRTHHGATGRNWLFFGERNQSNDFFYQKEWEAHQNLRLHTAFSRDQEEKIYVQDRLIENGKELYDWIQEGAHIYICGDAKSMAKEVEKALIAIFIKYGNLKEENARNQYKNLRKGKRILLDVY